MAGGGKGGSSTTSVEVPEWMESAAKSNLARAEDVSKIGYVPYYGPDVAAMTPMQEAAAQNVASAASAFGMQTPTGAGVTGMPPAQEFAGGIRGYSSAPMFEETLQTFGEQRPAQKAAIDDMFIKPTSGKGGGSTGSASGNMGGFLGL